MVKFIHIPESLVTLHCIGSDNSHQTMGSPTLYYIRLFSVSQKAPNLNFFPAIVYSYVCRSFLVSPRKCRSTMISMSKASFTRKFYNSLLTPNYAIRMCSISVLLIASLTLISLTWKTWRAPNNASKWQMVFNSAFTGLIKIINV